MAAGVPASRVQNIPTEKLNNKISGYAAVRAIYELLDKEVVAPWPGSITPMGVAGSPLTGHTRIGEDHLFPEVAKKLVKAGVDGMMRAYNSVGIKPCRWMSSLLACAATLRTRKTAEKRLVLGRRCWIVRRNSTLWRFLDRG